MSYRIPNKATVSLTTAADFDQGTNTPTIHASTSITVTSGGVFSATYTAPNTTNAATGVVIPFAAVGSAGTVTAQLQSAGVDVAGASASVTVANMAASTKIYFRFGTPHVFTTTAAGNYRVKLSVSGGSGTTSAAADSGGANFAYLATDDRNVAPGAGDDLMLCGHNGSTAVTVTVDGSVSIGSGTDTAFAAFRSWGHAIDLNKACTLAWQTGTSRTLTCMGNVLVTAGSTWQMGTTGTPVAIGTLANLRFDENGTTTNYGFVKLNTGVVSIQGAALTFRKTTLSSGVGTAASPFVAADSVDWSVGDELAFAPVSNNAANYDETETRFVITKNSATSYVLSATAGGGEAAFTYSHAAGAVFNLTRPCKIDTTNTSFAWYFDSTETTNVANCDVDGLRVETCGSSTTDKLGFRLSSLAAEKMTLDDSVFYRMTGSQGVIMSFNRDTRTHTWLILYDFNGFGNTGAFFINSYVNKTFQNCYVLDSQGSGFFVGTSTATLDNCGVWATGRASGTAASGFMVQNASNVTMNECTSNCNRTYGTYMNGAVQVLEKDCSYGTAGTNGVSDVFIVSDSYNKVVFDNCLFNSTTLISNYLNQNDGSEIAFNKFDQTASDHRWYTAYGKAVSVGAGLSDTNVHTSGSFAVRFDPEDAAHGFTWDFDVLVRVGDVGYVNGFVQKNAAFGTDDAVVDLYMPGLTPGIDTPSETITMPDDTLWNAFVLGERYDGTVPLSGIVRISAKSAAVGASLYVDDVFNGGNIITGLDVWKDGKPLPIMYPELGNPGDTWNYSTVGLVTPFTTGKKLVDGLTSAKFLALK